MTDDINESENIYSSPEVAAILKVKESTLRKYGILLEEQGYKFLKNAQGHRGYFDKDVIALKKLIKFKKHPDMTLKQACSAVVSWVNKEDVSDSDTEDITPYEQFNDKLLTEFEEFKNQQEQFNRELLDQLKKQQEYIEKSLNHRDQTLMAAIRESQKDKQLQIAAAQEAQQEVKNKKPWFYFWNK